MRRGVAGAAWATLISQIVAVILLVRKLTGKSMQQQTESEVDLSKALPLKLGWYGLPTLEVLGPFLALAGPLIVRCALGMVCVYAELTNSHSFIRRSFLFPPCRCSFNTSIASKEELVIAPGYFLL